MRTRSARFRASGADASARGRGHGADRRLPPAVTPVPARGGGSRRRRRPRARGRQPRRAAPPGDRSRSSAFLVGSWSGSAESGARVGGRVARFAPEFTGNYLVHRGSTILTADDGKEETIEEVGYFAYDREKRRYVAT